VQIHVQADKNVCDSKSELWCVIHNLLARSLSGRGSFFGWRSLSGWESLSGLGSLSRLGVSFLACILLEFCNAQFRLLIAL